MYNIFDHHNCCALNCVCSRALFAPHQTPCSIQLTAPQVCLKVRIPSGGSRNQNRRPVLIEPAWTCCPQILVGVRSTANHRILDPKCECQSPMESGTRAFMVASSASHAFCCPIPRLQPIRPQVCGSPLSPGLLATAVPLLFACLGAPKVVNAAVHPAHHVCSAMPCTKGISHTGNSALRIQTHSSFSS